MAEERSRKERDARPHKDRGESTRRISEQLNDEDRSEATASPRPGLGTHDPDDAVSQAHVPHEGDQN